MTARKLLHFSLGPVQGFVAQARRTRDLWAGSYLLSYLSGCALSAIKDARGEFVLPDPTNDALYGAISGGSPPRLPTDRAACIGSLPNRFKAWVPHGVNGGACEVAVSDAWKRIAKTVSTVLEDWGASPDPTIWSRQTGQFWEMVWVISGRDESLDWRKGLRSHAVPEEYGEKCSVCGEREEVSGRGKSSRSEMYEWWNKLRATAEGKGVQLGLGQKERLCAICLVKRVLPLAQVSTNAVGWVLPASFPSTHYMAALDWLVEVFGACASVSKGSDVRSAVAKFVRAAREARVPFAERDSAPPGVRAAGEASGVAEWQDFCALDGGAFFESVLRNRQEFPLGDEGRRDSLAEALRSLQGAVTGAGGPDRGASPFYALLAMDGDGLGALLSKYPARQGDMAGALAAFSDAVLDVVSECNGRLIYTGGDDVLALLPVSKALECARRCREAYRKVFAQFVRGIPAGEATISAAVEFAHMQTAFGMVIRDAHRLLDSLAKDACGRDGLACRVWKRGGVAFTWAQPWLAALSDSGDNTRVEEMARSEEYSSGFVYGSRDIFALARYFEQSAAGETAAKALLAAACGSRRDGAASPPPTEEAVERLLGVCRWYRRPPGVCEREGLLPIGLTADGALLARFLAQRTV